ncbi:MAG: hypothetical protein QOE04_3399 [Mycobacterium sp.]|nr:hypothetical protein [Mycobacterium sp.]MDT5389758.1 hypothetical protein [Mycobacterium sp.]
MPDDLLQRVIGPTAYSSGWWWLALLLVMALIAWYAGVLLWTMPGRRLRNTPVIGGLHDKFLRHRYAKAVRDIGDRYRAGELDAAPAGAAVSAELREFLRFVTGVRAEYMQLDDVADSALAPAAPLLAELSDAQFNDLSHVDVGLVSADAEELIRSWT